MVPVGASRYMAECIPGAKYVEYPGDDHVMWYGDADAVLDAIEEFLTGSKGTRELDRVLATVLFTDIVDATSRAAALGDRRWKELLADHHTCVRRELAQHRGTEVDTAGDGFFATFDGPARAIRCARGIVDAVRGLGLEVRAGLHTGECELHEKGVTGIAVH
ncbi:MAG: adenylate/guanylate cyclase domain-containing protein, partial [Gammaproteobacteria bacterium]|nr:adenylate/guanylate cyclase domain-containing protein [Gammaproteobacteria bacterium]